MHDLYTSLTYRPSNMELHGRHTLSAAIRDISLLLIVCVCLRSLLHSQPQKKVMRYSNSRSFGSPKLVPIVSQYATFLVFHCTYMHIVYRLRNTTDYWSKIWIFHCLQLHLQPPPVLFETVARKGLLLEHSVWKLVLKTRVSVPSGGENRMILRLLVLTQYQRVTDRRTDTPLIICLAQLSATETCWTWQLNCH